MTGVFKRRMIRAMRVGQSAPKTPFIVQKSNGTR
jgi:hypothetical protein